MPASAKPEPGPFTREVAAILSGLLARQGREQRDLAEAMGVSASQASRMLRGIKHWDVDHLDLACRFLRADLGAVVEEADRATVGRRGSDVGGSPDADDFENVSYLGRAEVEADLELRPAANTRTRKADREPFAE